MRQFKTASRSQEELKSATEKVVEAFAPIRGDNGQLNRAGMRDLKDCEFELGQIIMELTDDQVLLTDPTPFLVEVREGGLTDDFIWQEVSAALRVVDYAHGSKPQSQRLSFSERSLTTSAHEIVVEVPLIQIASGRYNPALISEVMAEAVNRDRIARILNALDAGIPADPDRTGITGYELRYAGLDETNLKRAIHGLYDEGLQPTIYGRHSALVGISDFPGWSTASEAAIREFETRGMVGSYQGAPIVALRDTFSKRTNSHAIRNDRIYLASGQPGAIFMRKDLSFLNFSEVDTVGAVYRVGLRFEDGLLVHDPYLYRIITL